MFAKYKIYIILIGIIIGLVGVGGYMANKNKKLKAETERLTTNIRNSKFDIETLKTANGELSHSVNSLTVLVDELEYYNSELIDELKDMRIKLKNIQSVAKIEYKYIYKTDTVFVEPLGKQDFVIRNNDDWVDFKIDVHTSEPVENITASNLEINMNDELVTVYEVKYKGCWFWKRAVGVKLHIKNDNPYHQLDKVETYQIKY